MRLASPPLALFCASLLVCSLAQAFELSSPDIHDGQPLSSVEEYSGFGCQGQNRAPALSWKDAPAGTQSFAITVYDPDAPTGSGWWHWLLFNLPASSTALPAAAGQPGGPSLPAGSVQSVTDYGVPGFGGACPPAGDPPHHYIFTVHALKVAKLDLDASAMPALVGYMLNANSLGKASLTATYARPATN
ncbi:YbhB/YbcL family Raf kinase inhibitor-like protein [Pseudomonas sp. SA3-5]|uniref:YbhB/YbcL family Raf kinase inhibitor-like protein n=2 Tax=Pseudomonas aestuarii TaxID=3018340 RepID=A0ABT4XHA8_9PSED|nr:YbhB/YbcL family Raf kinase inhibitor-like protein [Pseudomonas aestuarii]MDA7087575.1 YbhB/YbcL family Raf kinase inhibitor-like protein [Pseudomonas aestuarii]